MTPTPQLRLLRAEYENMLACVRCGQCLTSCPTYVLTMDEAEGPRGRIAMARALADGQLRLTPDLVRHEMNCLVCDACTAVCPAGVRMDPIQVILRQAIGAPARRSLAARLGFGLLTDLRRLRLVTRLLALYQRSGLQRLVRASRVLEPLGLAAPEAMLPERVSASPLVPDGRTLPAETAPATTRVAFFAGCVMSTALAELDRATVRVLRRAGCDVALTRGQGCCGALHAHTGDLATAKAMFRRNVAAFEGSPDPIVANAAGCSAMLKDYAHHLRDDAEWAERAAAFSARVVDLTELLATRELPFRRRLDVPVAYQDACHLAHAQRITAQPRALLRAIPGLELRELAEPGLCCGSAGVYNLTNPTESRQLQARKVDRVLATGAGIVATANPGCLLQLRAGLRQRGSDVEVKHLVELLDEATAP